MNKYAANMVEIFSSIQGEGMLVGLRQVFLRFHGCSLDCAYCDTQVTSNNSIPEFCQTENTPGRQDFSTIKNPVPFHYIRDLLLKWVSMLPNAHHSISVTGGEPLLHAEVLKLYLPELRKIMPIYLETNGIHFRELLKCIEFIDYISMDFKLPSTSKAGNHWDEHRKFLEIASQKDMYVKIVISDETTLQEIKKACEILNSVNRNIPLILQPLSRPDASQSISSRLLFELQEEASSLIKEIRIIPQTHKIMRLL
jgi:7-carboxy-7-deazaguanine synthase